MSGPETTRLKNSLISCRKPKSLIATKLENTSHSQTLMKQQYDKKLHPIAFSKIENGDNVLIENMYRNKKGGKLQDRWLGPYPVTKVNRTTVQVLRNHSLQLVKRSRLKHL
ncbi:hypothetical protein LOD99_11755 [Oopsacas minuta]|uniref:Uncharacterized protein n=1 Tax=Oopsacas minuta TaxID=111878 RepID=A0AAV7JLT8_9METZ|nr:hypothetical protein LOD99_11755 [Oopsacas minuta]